MQENELKPCPFCGVVPTIVWEAWKDISETNGVYKLKAKHDKNCFIYTMIGLNLTGDMTSSSRERLEEVWNRRT